MTSQTGLNRRAMKKPVVGVIGNASIIEKRFVAEFGRLRNAIRLSGQLLSFLIQESALNIAHCIRRRLHTKFAQTN